MNAPAAAPNPDRDDVPRGTFAAVIVVEVVVLLFLWWLGRHFST